jgi:hypothetical protein
MANDPLPSLATGVHEVLTDSVRWEVASNSPSLNSPPRKNFSDMVMTMVEWNGRLAETIVAQADQIVALNRELMALRTK